MSARAMMRMRATIEHDVAPEDPWGNEGVPVWEDKFPDPVPCFAWAHSRMEAVNEQTTVTVVSIRAMIPLQYDVTELDRVSMIQNRVGAILFPGPLNIRSVEYKAEYWEMLMEGDAG